VAALRLGERFAVAFLAEPDEPGAFAVVPLARDEILVTSWRPAMPGDGLAAFVAGVPAASERAIAADQTNASVIVGERVIVKWFRRVGPGPSRATTLLAHLDAVGFAELPQPLGTVEWVRPDGPRLTIAQGDAWLPDASDGWDWALARLERHVAHGDGACPDACDPWIGAPLGRLVRRLHAALATSSTVIPDPVGEASPDVVATWGVAARATLAEAVALPASADDGFAIDSIAGGMRAELDGLPTDRSIPIQPVHGDLHVGQVLEWSGGLAVIDFDGNPALGPEGNALRQPAERDVAQMLSSLDHLGRVVDHRTAGAARPIVDAWIARTRQEFLAEVDPDQRLLAAFEVEQECRELVYAGRFLPRWRYAPLATLRARYDR
jgi:maltokinase